MGPFQVKKICPLASHLINGCDKTALEQIMAQTGEGYRFLEHVTDAYIEAWGPTVEKAFAKAAEGFYDTILNLGEVGRNTVETISVEGHDELELLYNWLEALLLQFDIQGMVYSQFDLAPILRDSRPLKLEARLRGEEYDRDKHGSKTEIKGVTYHMMNIENTPTGTRLRFLLDL